MENASKALIIAGAILISIVLITLGVVILGQGQDVVNSSKIDEQVVSTWNQKFTQYLGDKVTGANVNSLINSVISSNAISKRDGEYNKYIVITSSDSATTVGRIDPDNEQATGNIRAYTKGIKIKAKPGMTYEVKADFASDGYIYKLTINVK